MNKQIYYEDVEVGNEIPTLVKHPTPRQLVKWAGVSGDFYEIHYSKEFALKKGIPNIIVHGMLTMSFLVQLMVDWIGEWGTLRKIRTSNRGMLFPDEDIVCKGKVINKYVEGKDNFIECEIWAENPRGETCVLATTLATLPARKG